MSIKKCKGCGVLLQNERPEELGYVIDITKDYCKRCFRLRHYNENLVIKLEDDLVRNKIKEFNGCIVYIVDCLFYELNISDEIISLLTDKKLIVILSKIDLLPHNLNIDKYLLKAYNFINHKFKKVSSLEVISTRKKDPNFKELFFEIASEYELKDFLFIGYSNAGKSTIINSLIEKELLTTSYYLNTSVDFNEIKHNDYRFIDCPGFINKHDLLNYLTPKSIKKVSIQNTLKPLIYQLYSNQLYCIEGLVMIEINSSKASLKLWLSNHLNIHRTAIKNKEHYYLNHFTKKEIALPFDLKEVEFISKHNITLGINGLGIIEIIGKAKIKININKNIQVERLS